MKVLLTAINAKYIHSNLGVYCLKAYAERELKKRGFSAEIRICEYTINNQMEKILGDLSEKAGYGGVFLLYLEYLLCKEPGKGFEKGAPQGANLAGRAGGIL